MRYNIFEAAHSKIKQALLHTGTTLACSEETSGSDEKQLVKLVASTLAYVAKWQHAEETFIHGMVFDYEPSVWDAYRQQHQRGSNLSRRVAQLVAQYNSAVPGLAQASIMHEILLAYDELAAHYNRHIVSEEAVLNEILWRYYTDMALQQGAEMMLLADGGPATQQWREWAPAIAA